MGCSGDWSANPRGIQKEFDIWYDKTLVEGELKDSPKVSSPVVWRREIPYYGSYPDLRDMKDKLERTGCEVRTIFVIRDWDEMFKSTFYRHPERRPFDKLFDRAMKDHLHILEAISDLQPFTIFNCSILFKYPNEMLKRLERFTGLTFPMEAFVDIRLDTDSKWKDPIVIQSTAT
jgi:hypothetical protein